MDNDNAKHFILGIGKGTAAAFYNFVQALGIYYIIYLAKYDPNQVDISKFFSVYFAALIAAQFLGIQ